MSAEKVASRTSWMTDEDHAKAKDRGLTSLQYSAAYEPTSVRPARKESDYQKLGAENLKANREYWSKFTTENKPKKISTMAELSARHGTLDIASVRSARKNQKLGAENLKANREYWGKTGAVKKLGTASVGGLKTHPPRKTFRSTVLGAAAAAEKTKAPKVATSPIPAINKSLVSIQDARLRKAKPSKSKSRGNVVGEVLGEISRSAVDVIKPKHADSRSLRGLKSIVRGRPLTKKEFKTGYHFSAQEGMHGPGVSKVKKQLASRLSENLEDREKNKNKLVTTTDKPIVKSIAEGEMEKSFVSVYDSRLEKAVSPKNKVINMPPMKVEAKVPPKNKVIELEGMKVNADKSGKVVKMTGDDPVTAVKKQMNKQVAPKQTPPMAKSLDPAVAARMNTQPISRRGRGVNISTDNAARQQLAKSFSTQQGVHVEDDSPRRVISLRPLKK